MQTVKDQNRTVPERESVYGPATTAKTWGCRGCPILPRVFRKKLDTQKLDPALCDVLGGSFTYGQLDSEFIGCHYSEELRLSDLITFLRPPYYPHFHQHVRQLHNTIAVPAGVTLTWLKGLPLQTRTHNAVLKGLSNQGVEHILHRPITIGALMKFRGMGIASLIDLLCVMESTEGQQATEETLGPTAAEVFPHFDLVGVFQEADERGVEERLQSFSSTLEVMWSLALWAQSETEARTFGEAIESAMTQPKPLEEWQRFSEIKLGRFAQPLPHPYEILDGWATQLGDRERTILRERIARGRRRTLEDLACSLTITRERVRQLEHRLKQRLKRFLSEKEAKPIMWRVETVRAALHPVALQTTVKQLLRPPSNANDYHAVLLDLAGPCRLDGEWLISDKAKRTDPTPHILSQADEFGRLDLDFATKELSKWGLDSSLHIRWLNNQSHIRYFNGQLVRWGTSVSDRLAFALADLDRAATLEELRDHIQETTSSTTALNAIALDERIVKVDLNHYALAEWGLPVYSSVAYSIRNFLEEHGKPMPIQDVVEYMLRNFSATESTVRAYCAAPLFVMQDGLVRLRTTDFSYPDIADSLRRSSGIFRLGLGRVAILIRVDADILRGSGRALAQAGGMVLHVKVNDRLTFSSVHGESVTLTYPETSIVGPSIGSTRAIVERLSGKANDLLTLMLDRSDMSVKARLTRLEDHEPGWALVSRLTGVEAGSGMDGLAQALACQRGEVRAVLSARRDDTVIDALPPPTSSSRLEHALSELGNQIVQARAVST